MAVKRINKRLLDTVPIPAGPGPAFYWDDEIKGFGLKVTPRARKAFLFQYRALPPEDSAVSIRDTPTKRFEIGIYPRVTVDKARDIAEAWAKKVRPDPGHRARDPQAEKVRAKGNTWAAAVTGYTADMQLRGKASADDVRQALDNHVTPKWRDRPLEGITRQEAKDLLRKIATQKPVMANRLAAYIQALFNWALDAGKIDASPMGGLKKPAAEQPRERMQTMAEIAEIWRATEALEPNDVNGPIIQLRILTGMRRGAIGKMRWSEIDREQALWSIPSKSIGKSGQPHLVILSPVALAVLARVESQHGRRSGPYVFGKDGKTPFSGFSKADKRFREKLLEGRREADPNAELPNWRLHDLRRTFETTLTRLGFDADFVHRLTSHVTHRRGNIKDVYNLFWKERPERERAWNAWGAAVMEAVTS